MSLIDEIKDHLNTGDGDSDELLEKAAWEIILFEKKVDSLQMRIAELEAKIPRWIPVSERLPPEKENVLCYFEEGDIEVFYWFMSRRNQIKWMCGIPPTHWMPLPDMPGVSDE